MSRTPRTESGRSLATELVELLHVTERELAEVKAERDALTAQVHVLREALEQIAAGLSPNSQRPHVETAREALFITPSTALKGWVRRSEVAKEVPTNWCDPMLTGPDAVLGAQPYNCLDIERLLLAIRDRIAAARKELGRQE